MSFVPLRGKVNAALLAGAGAAALQPQYAAGTARSQISASSCAAASGSWPASSARNGAP